jgi:hypothetical protein
VSNNQPGAKRPVLRYNPLSRHISSLRLITVYFTDQEQEVKTYFILAKDTERLVRSLIGVRDELRRYPSHLWDDPVISRITSVRPQPDWGPGGVPLVCFESDTEMLHSDETVLWHCEEPDEYEFDEDE